MNLWRLTLREISHRRLHFGLGLISVSAAVSVFISTTILLRDKSLRDEDALVRMERQQKEQIAEDQAARAQALQERRMELENKLGTLRSRLRTEFAAERGKLSDQLGKRQMELEGDLRETQVILRASLKEREFAVAKAGAELQDAMRKITKGLGFNILILPRDQDLNRFHLEGVATAVMPEALVTKLAGSKIVTINHLLPVVTRRIKWPERDNLEVVLIGTRGEVPLAHRDPKKPLIDAVPKGVMIVGHTVGRRLGIKAGQEVELLGRKFKVAKVHGERGSMDDSSIWLNLGEAQELLKMQNVINAILALECNCATVDRVGEIRTEIAGILPGTQIIERGSQALARAEARNKAKAQADADLEQADANARKTLEDQQCTAEATLAAQKTANEETLAAQSKRDTATLKIHEDKNAELITAQRVGDVVALKQERENAAALLQNERISRGILRAQNHRFADILIPLVVAASALWVGLLTYGNARLRQAEVGILRAIGLKTGQVLGLFLGKALLLGLLGAALGLVAGLAMGLGMSNRGIEEARTLQLFEARQLLIAAALAPVIAMLGSWLPAILAARQDPAAVLQEE
ncbi:MAG: hypothetical protein CMO66_00570 [Verrucomicrobiales bacterium]|nr:hypothetical protein [Verrucomicrobiales bacterium]|tara:strand:- start:1290 stop:3035 length:1746 start_codon:yes stop_codon:yes gene_type:complete